jgi:hypothetical protein
LDAQKLPLLPLAGLSERKSLATECGSKSTGEIAHYRVAIAVAYEQHHVLPEELNHKAAGPSLSKIGSTEVCIRKH